MTETEKKKIAAVDDDPIIINLLDLVLKEAGFAVVTALRGEDCLPLILSEKPDLVLLDIDMPGLDGHTLLKKIKGDKVLRSLPVIMLTGKTEAPDFEKAVDKGADWYITKPFDIVELVKTVNYVLEKSMTLADKRRG